MGRRLDDTDLDNLEMAARRAGNPKRTQGPPVHPVDVLRLIEEVRWWKENCVKYVSGLPLDDPRFAFPRGTFDRPGSDAQVIDLTEQSTLGVWKDVHLSTPIRVAGGDVLVTYEEGVTRLIAGQSLPKNDDGDTPTVVKGN